MKDLFIYLLLYQYNSSYNNNSYIQNSLVLEGKNLKLIYFSLLIICHGKYTHKPQYLPRQDCPYHGKRQLNGWAASRDFAISYPMIYSSALAAALHPSQTDQETQENPRKTRLPLRHNTISASESTNGESSNTRRERYQGYDGIRTQKLSSKRESNQRRNRFHRTKIMTENNLRRPAENHPQANKKESMSKSVHGTDRPIHHAHHCRYLQTLPIKKLKSSLLGEACP